jgi:hypothetical protein
MVLLIEGCIIYNKNEQIVNRFATSDAFCSIYNTSVDYVFIAVYEFVLKMKYLYKIS